MDYFKEITQEKTPIVITSHPRSGTHLTIDLIRRHFPESRIYKRWGSNDNVFLSIGSYNSNNQYNRSIEAEALKLISPCTHPVIKLHTYAWQGIEKNYPHWIEWMTEKGKTIFVYRNIYSVLTSMHLYEQSFNENARCPLKEFIRQSYLGYENRIMYWNNEMIKWKGKKNTLLVSYEEIITKTEQTINKLGDFIDLKPKINYPLLPSKVNSIWHARLQRIFSTNPTSTAIVPYDNKTKNSEWLRQFDKNDLAFIRQYAEEAMSLFGYKVI
nr:sulfotransferase domain-containing protein [uncultured Carboxylicivirga sp.]